MSESYLLAHDLGTTGNKATLYDIRGRLKKSYKYEYQTLHPRPSWSEQDPVTWWEAVKGSTQYLLEESGVVADEILAVSFSGQMMGCLPVKQDGVPLRNAIIWADQRATKQTRYVEDVVGMDMVYKVTGHRPSPTYPAEKILWLKENEQKTYDDAQKIVQAKDFIIHKLTDQWVTEPTDASFTHLYDLREKAWSEKILDTLSIPSSKLPELRSSTDVVGEVTNEAASELGLKEGTPVVAGGGDGACATVGAGAIRKNDAYNYLGASSWLAYVSDEVLNDPKKRTFSLVHLDNSLYQVTGTMQSAGASLDWIKEELCQREIGVANSMNKEPHTILEQEISKSEPGARGLLFLPYLMGERSPHWDPDAKGVFLGLTTSHKKRDMLRAVLEGVGFNLRIIMEAIEEQGSKMPELKAIGGGMESEIWRQILSDIYQKPILLPEYIEEATSLGAAIAAGVGVGVFEDFSTAKDLIQIKDKREPNEENKTVYSSLYNIFCRAYDQLNPLFTDLSNFSQ